MTLRTKRFPLSSPVPRWDPQSSLCHALSVVLFDTRARRACCVMLVHGSRYYYASRFPVCMLHVLHVGQIQKLLCFIYMSPVLLGYGSLAPSSHLSLFLAVSGLTLVVVPETQRHPTVTCARTNLVRCARIRVKYNQAIKRWRNVRRRAVT